MDAILQSAVKRAAIYFFLWLAVVWFFSITGHMTNWPREALVGFEVAVIYMAVEVWKTHRIVSILTLTVACLVLAIAKLKGI